MGCDELVEEGLRERCLSRQDRGWGLHFLSHEVQGFVDCS